MSSDGLGVDPNKIDKISQWPTPTSKKQVSGFLGLVNWIKKFIKPLPALLTATLILNKITAKRARFHWTTTQEQAFNTIKTQLRENSPLRRLDYDSKDPIWLITDASNTGIGGIIAQGPTWETARPIEFETKQYNEAQKSYPTHEQELLAIMICLKKWRNMLLHHPFQICTDNESLKYLMSQRDLSPRQARWTSTLSEFDFTVVHIPGKRNIAADALSRYPHHQEISRIALTQQLPTPKKSATGATTVKKPVSTTQDLRATAITTITFDQDTLERISKAYKRDAFFSKAFTNIGSIKNTEIRGNPPCLYYEDRLCIPDIPDIKEKILHDYHDALGHFSARKMFPSLALNYYWPTMTKDCEQYVQQCDPCQRNKSTTTKPHGKLQTSEIPSEKCAHITIDWIEKMIKSGVYDSIMSITEVVSGLVVLIPCKVTDTAATTARRFFDHWVKRFGIPQKITSDRDHRFVSAFWQELCSIMNIKQALSTAYHPQTDGRSEVTNKIAITVIRPLLESKHKTWSEHLSATEFAINNTVNASTGKTPFYVMYGFHPRHVPKPPDQSTVPAALETATDFKNMTTEVRDALFKTKVQQADTYNKKRLPDPDYKIGDQVLLSTINIRQRITKPGQMKKLMPLWLGPFKIIAKPHPNVYRLELPPQMHIHPNFNVNLLKPYHENDNTQFPDREYERPGPVEITDEDQHYEISDIIDNRTYRRKLEYLVTWKGWPIEDNTWVPATKIKAPTLIKQYWDRKGEDAPTTRKSPRLNIPTAIADPLTPHKNHMTRTYDKNTATGEKTVTQPVNQQPRITIKKPAVTSQSRQKGGDVRTRPRAPKTPANATATSNTSRTHVTDKHCETPNPRRAPSKTAPHPETAPPVSRSCLKAAPCSRCGCKTSSHVQDLPRSQSARNQSSVSFSI